MIPIVLTRCVLFHITARLDTTGIGHCRRGTYISWKLDAIPGDTAFAITTYTAAATASASAATAGISRLVHAEHPAFFSFSPLAPDVAWAAVTRVKHAALTFPLRKSPPTTLKPTEHGKHSSR
jgi:hypothetical protein